MHDPFQILVLVETLPGTPGGTNASEPAIGEGLEIYRPPPPPPSGDEGTVGDKGGGWKGSDAEVEGGSGDGEDMTPMKEACRLYGDGSERR